MRSPGRTATRHRLGRFSCCPRSLTRTLSLVAVSDPGLVGNQVPAEDRRLRILFDNLPALIGYWDRDLRNVIANHAYVEWFGLTPGELKGMHISQVVGETIYALNLPFMQAALAGSEQVFQRTLIDVAGAVRHTQVSYSPDVVDGVVVGLFVMTTDVTQRVETQRQMDEAQRLAELGSWTLIPATGQLTWSRQLFRARRAGPGDLHTGHRRARPAAAPRGP